MRRSRRQDCRFLLALLLVVSACDGGGKKEEDDNGGDHVPDDKVYVLDTALPTGAALTGLTAQEVTAPFLRRFVSLADHYYVCLDPAAFDDQKLTTVQTLLTTRTGVPAAFGLEGIVNHVLATVDHFSPGTKPASSRVEIDLVRADAQLCHLVVTRADVAHFPFTNLDFTGMSRVYLNAGQLHDAAGGGSQIPVAYVAQETADADVGVAVQYLIGRFFGLGESALAGSDLNISTDTSTPGRGWLVEDGNGLPRTDDDAQILFGFALMYQGVLKATDLDTIHHYGDLVLGSDAPQDPDLQIPAGSTPIAFVDAIGNAYLTGVRMIGGAVTVCVENVSGVTVTDDRLAAYFAFAAPTATGSVTSLLHDRDAAISPVVTLAKSGCNLVVELKNTTQYPFATMHVNGLYGQEGTLKAKSGATTTVPVIYLDASTLELDPAAQATSAKPIALVLQHEFAHFLGFRHSTSTKSILSPAGYNAGWDMAGGDAKIFDEFVKQWKLGPHP